MSESKYSRWTRLGINCKFYLLCTPLKLSFFWNLLQFCIDSGDLKGNPKHPRPEDGGIDCTEDEHKTTCYIVCSVFVLAFLIIILISGYIFYRWRRMARKRRLEGHQQCWIFILCIYLFKYIALLCYFSKEIDFLLIVNNIKLQTKVN